MSASSRRWPSRPLTTADPYRYSERAAMRRGVCTGSERRACLREEDGENRVAKEEREREREREIKKERKKKRKRDRGRGTCEPHPLVQGHHVAVLVKANKQDIQSDRPLISVDIKSSQQFLSDCLIQELQDVLA